MPTTTTMTTTHLPLLPPRGGGGGAGGGGGGVQDTLKPKKEGKGTSEEPESGIADVGE